MVTHVTFNHQEAGSNPAGPKFIRITKNTEHNRVPELCCLFYIVKFL
jgi:hypothetical protein